MGSREEAGGGGGESACRQAQEGGGPTRQTMPVLKGAKWKRVGGNETEDETPCQWGGCTRGLGLEGSATSSGLDPMFLKRTGERGCTLLPGALCSGLGMAQIF